MAGTRPKGRPYEHLVKVELPAPPLPSVKLSTTDVVAVIGDTHFPRQSKETCALFIEAVRLSRPKGVVLNGDMLDLLAVSKYPKSQRKGKSWGLDDEAAAYQGFLHQLFSVLPRSAWIRQTAGNHDGNTDESRWWRYLNANAPELVKSERAEELLGYRAWFLPKWAGRVELVEKVWLEPDLLVLHGHVARKWAGTSARAHGETWHTSTVNSHTHRLGSGTMRLPKVGSRREWSRRNFEIGCGCSLDPEYGVAPDWTNGFALIHTDPKDYGIELVEVRRGRAVIPSLGTLTA